MAHSWSFDARVPEDSQAEIQAGAGLPFPLGKRGRFELLSVLGKGGMGVVYRARDAELDREVALKCVLGSQNEKRLERFRREGEVTASLHHPGILRVHATGVLDGVPYLVYELVPDARTLTEVQPGLDRRQRLELLRDIARALGHAHAQGVVHRDVKPENVLITAEGRPLVADFGLAAARGLERLTKTGAVLGTPYFMAPEMLMGERDAVGPASDVWALGVTLYEMLTDEIPYQHAATLVELASQIATGQTPSPRAKDPSVSRALDAICRRAMAQSVEDRYPNADELADDLDAFLSGRPLSASTTHTAFFPPFLRGSGVRALLVVPALASLAVLAFLLLRSGPEPAARKTVARAEVKSVPAKTPVEAPAVETGERPDRDRLRRPLFELRHGRWGKTCGTFSKSGHLLTCGPDGYVRRWTPAGEAAGSWPVGGASATKLITLRETALGILVGGHGLFLIPAGEKARTLHAPRDQIEAVAVGEFVVAGTESSGMLRFSLAGKPLPPYPGYETQPAVYGVAFSPDGKLLATVSGESTSDRIRAGALHLWDVGSGTLKARVRTPGVGRCLAFAPHGGTLVIGCNTGQLLRYSAGGAELEGFRQSSPDEGLSLRRAPAHQGSLRGVAFSPDGKLLYSVSKSDLPNKNELRVWNVATRTEARPVARRPHELLSVQVSGDGRLLALGTKGGYVEVWAAR